MAEDHRGYYCTQCGCWIGHQVAHAVRDYGLVCDPCYRESRVWGYTPQEHERQGDAA